MLAPEALTPLKHGRGILPRDWVGERVFLICSGASLDTEKVKRIRGRVVAVKHVAKVLPDANVLFYGGREFLRDNLDLINGFKGEVIARGDYPGTPERVLRVSKSDKDHRGRLSSDPRILGGWDTGAAGINMVDLRGAAEIVVVGMDMKGGHLPQLGHRRGTIGKDAHKRHAAGVAEMAADLKAKGTKVWNCSPISALTCFEKRPLDDFL